MTEKEYGELLASELEYGYDKDIVAEKLGVSRRTINYYIAGKRSPEFGAGIKLALLFHNRDFIRPEEMSLAQEMNEALQLDESTGDVKSEIDIMLKNLDGAILSAGSRLPDEDLEAVAHRLTQMLDETKERILERKLIERMKTN